MSHEWMARRRVLALGLGGIAGLGAQTLIGGRKAMAQGTPETVVYVRADDCRRAAGDAARCQGPGRRLQEVGPRGRGRKGEEVVAEGFGELRLGGVTRAGRWSGRWRRAGMSRG